MGPTGETEPEDLSRHRDQDSTSLLPKPHFLHRPLAWPADPSTPLSGTTAATALSASAYPLWELGMRQSQEPIANLNTY